MTRWAELLFCLGTNRFRALGGALAALLVVQLRLLTAQPRERGTPFALGLLHAGGDGKALLTSALLFDESGLGGRAF